MKGIEYVDTFNFNPHKWMLVNFDCSALWFKDKQWMEDTYNLDAIYLRQSLSTPMPSLRNCSIPFGRRFRSLKLWFVLRIFGVEYLQSYIRNQINYAKKFESKCLNDSRFEIIQEVLMGLVCFRLKEGNIKNEILLEKIYKRGNIFLVPGYAKEKLFLRFAIGSNCIQSHDIDFIWDEISNAADEIL